MRRLLAILSIISVAVFLGGGFSHAQAAGIAKPPAGIVAGLWEGSISLKRIAQSGEGSTESPGTLSSGLRLRLLDQGKGALMDIAEQSMFGYPLDDVSWSAGSIRFVLDALGPGEELACEGIFSASTGSSGTGGVIIGTAKARSWKGTFLLRRSAGEMGPHESPLSIPTGDGLLPGTLLQPGGAQSRTPLVLLLSGAGTSDRDGNNYNVPGRSNTLSMLAEALYGKGVATFRYDKRGSGEAYLLERKGMTTSLAVHVSDAAEVLKHLLKMNLFSRIIVAGMNEGAWTGAAAINSLAAEGILIDGIVVLDGSGVEPRRELEASIQELDPATRKEAESIVESIVAGKAFPSPSAQLSDFFTSSRIEWLESWLKFDPSSEMAKVEAPILFVYGSADLQVSREAFERLLKARPNAAARLIPSMNYLLKQVKTEEENYDSFTNPSYPLAEGLVDLIAAFAKAKPLPPGSATLPYE